jgi:predicted DNA-binding ribbon-helix-helix protein
MKSLVVKRSIVIASYKTSVSLEDAFWTGLKEIAAGRGVTLSELVGLIDEGRGHGNLSSAIRLFVLDHYRGQAEKMRSAAPQLAPTYTVHSARLPG